MRLIKPKKPDKIESTSSGRTDVKLVPKWHIVPTSRFNTSNMSSDVNSKDKERSQNCHTTLLHRTTVPSSPIQTIRPTSEPRKATLMTENGPVDVNIKRL